MSYYGDAQWPASAGGQPTWDHQTPPTRSGLPPNNPRDSTTIDTLRPGASSTIPREETTAFWYQFEGTFIMDPGVKSHPVTIGLFAQVTDTSRTYNWHGVL